jgi:hypothetical protein
MKIERKHLRASVFGLVVVAFLLPFVIVSCPDHGSVKVTGIQLSAGTTIRGDKLSSFTSDQYIKAQPFAYLALLCAFLGIAASLAKHRQAYLVTLAISLIGVVLLLLLKNQIGIIAVRLAKDDLRIRYDVGYWTAFSAYILSAVLDVSFIPAIQTRLVFPKKRRKRK